MDIKDIRKANLIRIIGNVHERGAPSQFAKKYNLPPDQVRHILTGYRTMGEKLARKFEEAIGLPSGELDKDLSDSVASEAATYMANNLGIEALDVITTFRELDAEKRKIVAQMIRSLAPQKPPSSKQ